MYWLVYNRLTATSVKFSRNFSHLTLYLQGHTKTGPFLERGNKPGDYYNSSLTKSQSSDAMERLEMPPMTSSVVGLTARFSEITARDRRARISDLVTQICETPPLIEGRMVLNTGTG